MLPGGCAVSAFVFALSGAYALWRWDRRPVTAARLIGAGLLAVALTAAQWLPLLVILPTLSRTGLTAADAGIFSLQAAQWIGLILSDRGGSNETLLYVGIGVLALAGVGILSAPRKRWFWGAAALLSGGYALGANSLIWPLLIRLIPPLLWLRVPPRAWIVGVFALIVLAGCGLQTIRDATQRVQWIPLRRGIMRYSALLIGLGAACALIGFAYRPTAALIAFGLIIAAGAALIGGRRVPLGAWALLIVIDLLLMDSTLIEGRDQSEVAGSLYAAGTSVDRSARGAGVLAQLQLAASGFRLLEYRDVRRGRSVSVRGLYLRRGTGVRGACPRLQRDASRAGWRSGHH